jgi:hypothetical protein
VKKIKVTGYMYVEPEDIDDGPNGPLTEEAYNEALEEIFLDDVTFELVDE